jgi:hypothetical protein
VSDSRRYTPGPTASLALALFHRWEPERLFVIVTVYIDESGTHESGVTILGGWVGRLGQWAAFDPLWKRLLKRNGLTHFHSKPMRHSQDEFKGWSVKQKGDFMAAAAKVALKNLAFGFTIILKDDDYKKHYVADHRPKEIPIDSRYGLCFRYCLGILPTYAKEAFKDRELDIHFVLESGGPSGDAHRVWKKVRASRKPNEQEIIKTLKTLTEGDKADYPGLQAADVNAYSAYQHMTRYPLKTIPMPEGGLNGAKKLQRVPVLHLPLQEPELKALKQFILDEIGEKKARREKVKSSSSGGQPS